MTKRAPAHALRWIAVAIQLLAHPSLGFQPATIYLRHPVVRSTGLRWSTAPSKEEAIRGSRYQQLGALPLRHVATIIDDAGEKNPQAGSLRNKLKGLCHRFKHIRELLSSPRIAHRLKTLRRRVAVLAVALFLFAATATCSFAAVSAGRTGGSFGPSSSSSSSTQHSYSTGRSYSRSLPIQIHSYNYYSPPPWITFRLGGNHQRQVYARYDAAPVVASKRFSASDVMLLTGTGALIVYGFANNYRGRGGRRDSTTSPLGPGASVASVTLSLNVPNRDDPNCILNRLRVLSERADTRSRKGVQDLVSEGTIAAQL